MSVNTTRFSCPNEVSLVTIKHPSKKRNAIDKKSDSNDSITAWPTVQSEPSNHVKFIHDEHKRNELPPLSNHYQKLSLPDIHQRNLNQIRTENYNKKKLSLNHSTRLSSIISTKFHRLSDLSYLSNTSPFRDRISSINTSKSIINSTTHKNGLINQSLLEFNSSLSNQDREKLDIICQKVPDAFQVLLPISFKLGVILWPAKLFNNKEQLTVNEIRQRQYLISIIEKDRQDSERELYLQHLYGNILSNADTLSQHHQLRESLSLQGQLSLIEAYRDEIENELTKKIPNWKSIPMKLIRTSLTNVTNPRYRLSFINSTFQAKKRFLRNNSSRNIQSHLNTDRFDSNELFSFTTSNEIDRQWKRKFLVKIIEQGMNILDETRKLSPHLLSNYDDVKGHEIVRRFKQWLFLWSTLYIQEN